MATISGLLPARILVHTAVPAGIVESGTWAEGERDETPTNRPAFRCVYFPPGTREAGRNGRILEQPILLYTGFDVNGNALPLGSEDRVVLTNGPGLTTGDLGEYQVDGSPQPLGRPGRTPKGYQVNLRRVRHG